jgi:phospholipid/cholesterol/gamma-HCH transport system ATP-binding protein
MVFQSAALFDSLSIWENVGFFLLEHTNKEETEIRERAAEALGAVGLEGILDSKPEQLSGGMRKRVGIARALISKPQVIFYDEPTAGLDVLTADSIVRLIKKIHSQYKTTDVIVIHDIALARRLADRIAVIDEGSIVITGTWDEVVQFQHPLIRRFLSIGGDYEETNIHS